MFLVLDTNIFRAHSLQGVHFSALSRISSNGHVDFRIPYIVDREVFTQRLDSVQKSFSAIETNLNKLSWNDDLSGDNCDQIRQISANLSTMQQHLVTGQVRESWEKWKSLAGAETLPLLLEESTAGMEAYFNGTEPFEGVKSRKDIPDSFIFQQLRTLAVQGEVTFVCKDGRLRQAAENLINVTVLEDLPDFLESDQAQEYFTAITEEQLSNNTNAVKTFLQERLQHIHEIVRSTGGDKIVSSSVDFEESWANDNEHTVSSYGAVDEVSVDFSKLSYFGDGEFELPVEYEVEAYVEYFIDKAEYYSLGESEAPSVSEWNDYVYQAESEETVHVKGILKIAAPVESLDDIVDGNGKISISDLEIIIDSVDSIEVVS